MLVLSGGSLDAERATCFSAGRRQGVARRASNFLSLRRKKVTKERATLLCVSLRCATGNLRCSVRGCAAELTARCALRSNNCGESVHEVRVSCGTRTHPLPCASRHAQKGTRNRTSPQAIAALGLDCAAQGACAREMGPSAAQRSNGPCGCPHPGFPSARAEKRRAGGACVCRRTHALRALTCRSCLNGARSAQ